MKALANPGSAPSYVTQFTYLAIGTTWNGGGLFHQFYLRLFKEPKDKLAWVDLPLTSLGAFMDLHLDEYNCMHDNWNIEGALLAPTLTQC